MRQWIIAISSELLTGMMVVGIGLLILKPQWIIG